MAATLHGLPTPVEIAPGYSLYAPGVTGYVMERDREAGTRSLEVDDDSLSSALAGAEMETLQQFELELEAESVTTRSIEADEPMLLAAPDLGPNVGYAALHTDEWGTLSWLFPVERRGATEGTRGEGGEVIFALPAASPTLPPSAAEEEGGTRGLVTASLRRAVRVVAWLTDEIIGAGAFEAARRWEEKSRPYGLLRVVNRQLRPIREGEWTELAAGRALLLLHGTFSTAGGAFGRLLASPHFERLSAAYGGRVLAFDHPSLHHDPDENIRQLLARLPPLPLEFDVITHSRGGLVGRALAERLSLLNGQGRTVRVRRAVYVAAPNQGTRLADGDHWLSFVDRYTNLMVALPDNAATITLEGVMVAVKLLAHGALSGLPGLQCFNPGASEGYLRQINNGAPHGSEYYAVAADFTPDDPGLLARFYRKVGDKVLDLLFEEPNDMVVPTRGCFEAGLASPGFPIPTERRRLFDLSSRVHHVNYFAHEAINEQLAAWLSAE